MKNLKKFLANFLGLGVALLLAVPLVAAAAVFIVPQGGTGVGTMTGIIRGNGTSSFTGITTSAGIAGVLSDETGSGALLFGTSPTITTKITIPNTGLHVRDTDASHDLIIKPGTNLSADRTLTVTTGDADRTLTLTGDASITGTNTGDQDLSGLVSKVGIPLDNQVGIWTGNGTIEGSANLTFNGSLLQVGANAPSSSPLLSVIQQGNGLTFGHQANSGYHSSLGATVTSGYPFLAFHGEAGTGDSFTTRGIKASLIRATGDGGLWFGNVANATGANQDFNLLFQFTSGGKLILGPNVSNPRLDVPTLTQSDQMTLGTAPEGFGVTGSSIFGMYMNVSASGWGWIQVGRADGSATAYDLILQKAGGKVGIGENVPSAKLHVISTTEQQRIGYDTSNYFSATVGSTGSTTFDLVGTSPEFTFSDPVNVTGNLKFGLGANRTIRPADQSVADANGIDLTILGGIGNGDNGEPGAVRITGAPWASVNNDYTYGPIYITGGSGVLGQGFDGGPVNITGGTGDSGDGQGGGVVIRGGEGGADFASGGGASLIGGQSTGPGTTGGTAVVVGGTGGAGDGGNPSGAGGGAQIYGGNAGIDNGGGQQNGGNVLLQGGSKTGVGGSSIAVYGADNSFPHGVDISSGISSDGYGLNIELAAGNGNSQGGSISLTAGAAVAGDNDGGYVNLVSGNKSGTGGIGYVRIQTAGSGIGALLDSSSISSSNKTFTFPNTSGTFALIDTAGNLKIVGTATRATTEGTNHLDIFNGTAPVGTLANGFSLYSSSGKPYVNNSVGIATPIGGTLFDSFADATVGGAEADVYTHTLAANTFNANGDKVTSQYGGQFVVVGTEATQLKVKFAGTTIYDSTAPVVATGTSSWVVNVTLIRVSSTVVRYSVALNTTGASGFAYASAGELTGLTLSGTNILKITGTSSGVGSGSGDIVGKMGFVEFKPGN